MHGTPLTVPTPLATSVFRPTAAAAGEMLAMGDQALMQMADEYRDAVCPRLGAETCRAQDLPSDCLSKHQNASGGSGLAELMVRVVKLEFSSRRRIHCQWYCSQMFL